MVWCVVIDWCQGNCVEVDENGYCPTCGKTMTLPSFKAYHLFLDDERDIRSVVPVKELLKTPNLWMTANSVAYAQHLVYTYGLPKFMSLDHDLGGDETVMQFLKWLVYDYRASEFIPYQVHSANPVGRDNIISFMESWKKSLASE